VIYGSIDTLIDKLAIVRPSLQSMLEPPNA